jgi:hypothetical protein
VADRRRNDAKNLKKDQSSAREVRDELSEEIRSSGSQPLTRQPNRDRARGDWDRTGLHHDEGTSRADADDQDERKQE